VAPDVGWVLGYSYICHASLLHSATTLVFEGKPVGTPDAGAFWRALKEHKVVVLFGAPKIFRAIKKVDPTGALIVNVDFCNLTTLFLSGERSDPTTVERLQGKLNRPVIDRWWQTELGWTMSGHPVGFGAFPVKL
jgi:propionyl-CoA synthetase